VRPNTHKTYDIFSTRCSVNRRQVLASGGLLLLGGCQQITGCASKNVGEIRCRDATLTTDQRDQTIPVVYGERTPAEQEILDVAIPEPRYRTCKPFSEAFESLSGSLVNNYSEQTEGRVPEPLRWPYVKRGNQYYQTFYREGDILVGNV